MASRRRIFRRPDLFMYPEFDEQVQFKRITKCFIRKGHSCGKYLGVSTSCFIACPSNEGVRLLIDLISEKLRRNGIDPVVAVDTRSLSE
jgi:hypothetical protein